MRIIELIEGLPQGGTLYHGTDVMSAARILYQDELSGRTDHLIWLKGTAKNQTLDAQGFQGVSLTRSLRFAQDWKGSAGVVFEFDGSRLRARHRLIPTDYYHDRREAEEFLVGSIKPVSAFLTHLYMSPATQSYCVEHDEELIEGHKDYEQLLNHPLLKVMPFPAAPLPYYNPRNPGKGMFG